MNPEMKKSSEVQEQVEALDQNLSRLTELNEKAGNVFQMILRPRMAEQKGKEMALSASECELAGILSRINNGFKDRLDTLEGIVRASAL